MIKWLFFDLGSTIIDESECDRYRFERLLLEPGAPMRGELEGYMRELSENNLHPYREAATRFHLAKTKWPQYLEKLYPDAKEVLEKLHQSYRMGIIANQSPGTEQRMIDFGIRQYFDVIISSAEQHMEKPDPEIFMTALRAACCRTEDAVMIGDRLDNDILPAARLGMKTIWVRQGMCRFGNPDVLGVQPDRTVQNLRELLEIL